MEDIPGSVVAVHRRPHSYFRLRLQVTPTFADAEPGQFVMVQVGHRLEPFLRRAFSIHDVSRDAGERVHIDLLGKSIGRGTTLLGRSQAGDVLPILGPLGRAFEMADHTRVALVAGGVGSAALLLLARRLLDRGQTFDFFYGGRSEPDLSRCELFRSLAEDSGGELVGTTEDGSFGETGLVTVPLAGRLEGGLYDFIYGCGPMPLLAALAGLCERHRIGGEAALETPMGCGYGACLGCAVPRPDGSFALCCKEGPVFRFEDVRW